METFSFEIFSPCTLLHATVRIISCKGNNKPKGSKHLFFPTLFWLEPERKISRDIKDQTWAILLSKSVKAARLLLIVSLWKGRVFFCLFEHMKSTKEISHLSFELVHYCTRGCYEGWVKSEAPGWLAGIHLGQGNVLHPGASHTCPHQGTL